MWENDYNIRRLEAEGFAQHGQIYYGSLVFRRVGKKSLRIGWILTSIPEVCQRRSKVEFRLITERRLKNTSWSSPRTEVRVSVPSKNTRLLQCLWESGADRCGNTKRLLSGMSISTSHNHSSQWRISIISYEKNWHSRFQFCFVPVNMTI